MGNNSHYWVNKEERRKQALLHTEKMDKEYPSLIKNSIENTKIYSMDFKCKKQIQDKITKITVINTDSVSALYGHEGKVAVLNFASYKNPGGMFINGSKAQEECLCHESYLYNVLRAMVIPYYDWNNQNKNRALYKNRGLYSPDILFNHNGEEINVGVITCAAPNKTTGQKYQNVSDEENYRVLSDRIRFVLDIAKENEIDTLVLGAYGCGVFGQDPKEVADIFKRYLTTTHKCFDKIVFAIPGGENLEAFERIFDV